MDQSPQENNNLPNNDKNKSDVFGDIINLKNEKSPKLLEEQWKYEKILLDYNIIDFTSKSKIM